MSSSLPHGNGRRQIAVIALALMAALSACSGRPDKRSPAEPPIAKGEVVSELDKAIFYVFHAKDNTYWFGSNERGVYRYNGKTLVNFTTKDGLVSNSIRGIQEDVSGNIYFTTYVGISKYDGQHFTTLSVASSSPAAEWQKQPDDLWFVGAQDAGVVYRYDGTSLHRLEFPNTKAGDDFIAQHPRSKYPNMKFSPYDVYSIFKDSKGNLWFGTAILGVCRYDGKSFAWLSDGDLRNGSFGARSIIEDNDGKFWFSNVLHRYSVDLSNPAQPSFRKEAGLRDAKDPNRLPFGGIMSSTVDRTGALWMATYGEGVWRYDGKRITHYPVTDGDKAITLFTISKDNQGTMWLGTQSAGAYKFNGTTFEKFRP